MKKNKSTVWDIFVNIFIILLIAAFIFSIYTALGAGPRSFFAFPAKNLFFYSLILLFSIFFVLLSNLVSLWFCSDWKDCVLIVPEEIRSRARNNIISAITGFTILIVMLFLIAAIMGIDIPEKGYFIRNCIVVAWGILYSAVLAGLLYRSFTFRNIILKLPSDYAGGRVQKRVSLLPYLFLTFLLFEHVYLSGLIFLKDMGIVAELVGFFQLLVVVWLFCAWRINDLFYTQKEYDSILQHESLKTSGLGSGIGTYPNSFFRIWIFSGFIYWGIPVFIYFLVVIVIVAMFLPLCKTIEKLG